MKKYSVLLILFLNCFLSFPNYPILISPNNGGECFIGNETVLIQWNNNSNMSSVLKYTVNNGSSWVPIWTGYFWENSYYWTVPANLCSDICKIKVEDGANPSQYDMSDNFFSIVSSYVSNPSLTTPSPGQLFCSYPVGFSCSGGGSCPKYHIQVANNSNYSPLILDVTILPNNTVYLSSNLTSGTNYWRARAENCKGNSGGWVTSTFQFGTPPGAATVTSPSSSGCAGTYMTFNATATNATAFNWVTPSGWNPSTGTGSNFTSMLGNSGNITATPSNNCGTGNPGSKNVTVNSVPSTVSVSGGGTYCNSATLSASGGVGGTIYWQGTTNNGTSTSTPSQSQTVSSSGTYYFRANNSCGWGNQGSATVTINAAPGTATVTGNSPVCQGTQQTYYASATNATSYIWTLPTGWTGSSTTNSISCTIGNSSGSVIAKPYNGSCAGSQGSKPVTVTLLPGTATVTGNSPVCQGTQQTYYASSTNASSYTWNLPSGWSGSSTTNSITYLVGNSSGTFSVSATPYNGSCAGPQGSKPVTVNPLPQTPVISPNSGFIFPPPISFNVEITLPNPDPQTTIYYTLDGSDPTTASSVYNPLNQPLINGTSNVTCKAKANKDGCMNIQSTISNYIYVSPSTNWDHLMVAENEKRIFLLDYQNNSFIFNSVIGPQINSQISLTSPTGITIIGTDLYITDQGTTSPSTGKTIKYNLVSGSASIFLTDEQCPHPHDIQYFDGKLYLLTQNFSNIPTDNGLVICSTDGSNHHKIPFPVGLIGSPTRLVEINDYLYISTLDSQNSYVYYLPKSALDNYSIEQDEYLPLQCPFPSTSIVIISKGLGDKLYLWTFPKTGSGTGTLYTFLNNIEIESDRKDIPVGEFSPYLTQSKELNESSILFLVSEYYLYQFLNGSSPVGRGLPDYNHGGVYLSRSTLGTQTGIIEHGNTVNYSINSTNFLSIYFSDQGFLPNEINASYYSQVKPPQILINNRINAFWELQSSQASYNSNITLYYDESCFENVNNESSLIPAYQINSGEWQMIEDFTPDPVLNKIIIHNFIIPSDFVRFAIVSIVARTWTGAINNDWSNPGNWNPYGVPSIIEDVTIPSSVPNFPIVSDQGHGCHNLLIQNSSSLIVNPGINFTVTGNTIIEE